MKAEKRYLPNLSVCIFLDLIGMSSFVCPFLAEFTDVIWAPVSAMIFTKLFGGRLGLIGGVLNFLEEILPFTDIIPSFTIAWFIRKHANAGMLSPR